MKVPSLEEAAYMVFKGLQAFVKEIEDALEILINKLKEMFGR
jgi:hypothetical protein